jgi:hypothetical protein
MRSEPKPSKSKQKLAIDRGFGLLKRKPDAAATIRRLRGALKRKPGDKTFASEWAEHKREERKLEDK